MKNLRSLRVGGIILVILAFLLGIFSTATWLQSNARWMVYLDNAKFAGAVLYDSLQSGGEPPVGVTITELDLSAQDLASNGQFEVISGLPQPALATNFSIRSSPSDERTSKPLTLTILSSDLRYPIADISTRSHQTPAETMGALTMLLATYCSYPVLIAKLGEGPWVRIEGETVWNCSAAPKDLRLPAAGVALISIAILVTLVLNSAAQFQEFTQMLRERKRIGGPDSYEANGLKELRDIVSTVNGYLAVERERLAERVAVLSSVSHDLGTPATRLKLRAALIPDADLRAKLEADINAMTRIIESVLTYTRAELGAEEPRHISLTSLIQSIVDDYQDVGSPVELRAPQKISVQGGRSLFMSRRGTGTLPYDDKVIIIARPIALGRAITNLIDNALKYGRRAKIGLERNANHVAITVEDEGTNITAQEIEDLIAPFKRGKNTTKIEGHGLGLTIVATIANMHGGELIFEPCNGGLRAKITLQRQ